MDKYARIKALGIGKRKSFRILLLLEIILLTSGVIGLFGKTAVYEYGIDDMNIHFGAYSEEQGGVCVENPGEEGNMVDFEGIALPRGVYQVQLHYTTDQDMINLCEVSDEIIGKKNIRTNGASLFSGLKSTDFTMWLLRDSSETVVHAYYAGVGTFCVQGLTIRQTNAGNRIILFGMLCLFTMVNSIYLYLQYDREYHIPIKNKNVTFCLGLTILAASIPLTVDYMLAGGDLIYHLMRVEGIKDGILAGQFPIRISPEWQQGYGYASPIFYGETVLYLAGILRLIGFTVTASYRIFMFVVVVATVLIAYFCFRKIFEEAYIGVFCSMLYTLSIYRFYKTWLCGSWGECFGVMFLPLIAYGFWRVLTQDIQEESYKRSWLPLTIGFTMLIQSHLLTCEMVGAFTILLCAILWKRVFRLRTFVVLAKTVVYSILLSAWFLVPFADYMLTGNFIIHNVSARTIQSRGLFLAHLFFTYFVNGENVFFDQEGMADTAPMGVGIVLIMALLVLAYLCFTGSLNKMKKKERVLGGIAGWFAVLAMLMSLSLFPWDRIQFLNGITATLVSSIQFPNRFLTIANICLTAVAGVVAKYVLDNKVRLLTACYYGGMIFLVFISNIYLLDNAMDRSGVIRIYNSEGMGTGYIAGAEYLPHGANDSLFMYHDPIGTEDIEVTDYEKLSLGAEARITDSGGLGGEVAFSLLYYKGYHAYDLDTGEELTCFAGDNFEVTVEIPADYEGNVKVRFESPWYWRAGEILTLLTLLTMTIFIWGEKRKIAAADNLKRGVSR